MITKTRHFGYKDHMEFLQLSNEDKKYLKNLLKTVAQKTKDKELYSFRCNAVTFDYKGDLNVDESIPEPIAVATSEALAGLLLCLIDTPGTRAVGGWLLGDSASRLVTYYTDIKSKEFEHSPFDPEVQGIEKDHRREYEPSDHYDRMADSEIR